jgi:Peptidase S24-like
LTSLAAGFPSPADDYLVRPLDFNKLLIAPPAATFAVRVAGNSMTGVGIFSGDIAVVERSVTASDGKIILGIFVIVHSQALPGASRQGLAGCCQSALCADPQSDFGVNKARIERWLSKLAEQVAPIK